MLTHRKYSLWLRGIFVIFAGLILSGCGGAAQETQPARQDVATAPSSATSAEPTVDNSATVQSISATTASESATVTWQPTQNPDVTGYDVRLNGDKTHTLSAQAATVTIWNLQPATKYQVEVNAQVGESHGPAATLEVTTSPQTAEALSPPEPAATTPQEAAPIATPQEATPIATPEETTAAPVPNPPQPRAPDPPPTHMTIKGDFSVLWTVDEEVNELGGADANCQDASDSYQVQIADGAGNILAIANTTAVRTTSNDHEYGAQFLRCEAQWRVKAPIKDVYKIALTGGRGETTEDEVSMSRQQISEKGVSLWVSDSFIPGLS